MSKSKCKRGVRGRSRVWSANLAARRPPARLSSSPPAEPASAEEEPKQVFGGEKLDGLERGLCWAEAAEMEAENWSGAA